MTRMVSSTASLLLAMALLRAAIAQASPVLITEIMYNPTECTDSKGEWLELFNSGSGSVDLTGWTVQDSAGGIVTLAPFSLDSGAYFLLAKSINGCNGELTADQTGLPSLNNGGSEQVTLRNADGTMMDHITYLGDQAAPPGYTYARQANDLGVPLNTGDSVDFAASTVEGGTPRQGPYVAEASVVTLLPTSQPTPEDDPSLVLITEILFNPRLCHDASGEWLELYNAGASNADISGWTLEDAAGSAVTIPPSSVLNSGSYYILAKTLQGCSGNLDANQTGLPSLNNGAETVILRDSNGESMDQVVYSGSAPPGFTFERQSDDTGAPSDIFATSAVEGGTPRSGYTIGAMPSSAPSASSAPSIAVAGFKAMSYNIEFGGSRSVSWKDVVKAENPDIVVFVEVGNWDDNDNALLNEYLQEFNSHFSTQTPYYGTTAQKQSLHNTGTAIMTRFPILSVTQLSEVTLDDNTTYRREGGAMAHDLMVWELDAGDVSLYVVGVYLKCCGGGDERREKTMEGLINYLDANMPPESPIVLMGDFNSISPFDTGPFAPASGVDLGSGPLSMLLNATHPHSSTVHTFVDAFRAANPQCDAKSSCCQDLGCVSAPAECDERGYTFVNSGAGPDYDSRIDFIIVSSVISVVGPSTVGDLGQVCSGSDHFAVDAILSLSEAY